VESQAYLDALEASEYPRRGVVGTRAGRHDERKQVPVIHFACERQAVRIKVQVGVKINHNTPCRLSNTPSSLNPRSTTPSNSRRC